MTKPTTFLLIPGADGRAWYWQLLMPELRRRGHQGVAVDLPKAKTAVLADYADAVLSAAGTGPTVVVAQSLGAFTGPLVCDRLNVQQLVLLNPMVPAPGETAGDWWQHTGHEQARIENAARNGLPAEFDLLTGFFHDVPADVTEQAFAADDAPAELDGVFADRWPLTSWPDVPTRILQGRDDRFFPVEFQRRIVRERLGINDIDVIPGGHLLALSQPAALAAVLVH